jgi:cyclohexadienyl dehydratase
LAVLATLALVGLSAPTAHAEATRLDAVIESHVLRVGTTGDYKPFTYRDPASGELSGIDIEMARSLASALGARVEFVATSWPSLMHDLEAGKFDIAMGGVSVSLERQKTALFSMPYLVDGKAPIARCADAAKYASLAAIDRPEVRVIVNLGGTNQRFADAHLKAAKVTVYPDNVTIFDQIVAGKADVMITDAIETLLQQKLHPGVLCATSADHPFNFSEKAYLLPRDLLWKEFVDR